VDDHPLMREGIAAVVWKEPDMLLAWKRNADATPSPASFCAIDTSACETA